MKKRWILFSIFISIIFYPFAANAEEKNGILTENGEKYYYINGVKQKGFQTINGKHYFFTRVDDHAMRTGGFDIDGSYYKFSEDGTAYQGWYEENGNKYYFDERGKRVSGFQEIDGKIYFFSRWYDNLMRTGVFNIDGDVYGFDENGVMQTGWYTKDGKKQYIFPDGKLAIGITTIDNKTYLFDESGYMLVGWQTYRGNKYYINEKTGIITTGLTQIKDKKYYFNSEGIMQTGFQNIDEKILFFSREDGRLRTGLFQIDGSYYYFTEEKGMQTGWQNMEDGTRYFDSNGKMQVGIAEINNKKYFFNEKGIQSWGFQEYNGKKYFFSRVDDHAMRTGLFYIDGDYYYFADSGEMLTGFQTIEGITRFFSRIDGHMRTSWVNIDGYMYYFNPTTGAITIGNITIDGVNYIFKEDGKLQDGFTTDTDGNTRYYFPDGSFANDWVNIAGTKYFFNALGVMIGKNVKKVIDVSAYQGVIDWDKVINEGNVDGVILRIAAGCEIEDKQLQRNISELKRLGIPYGIYIYSYAENYLEGRLYAEFTVKTLQKYNMEPTLGIYFDLERNNITNYLGAIEYEQIVRGFMEIMTNNSYGSISKIYTYKNYADTALNSPYLRSMITWIAQYNHYCTYTGTYNAWQYSSTEKIPGINTNTDVSVWFN